MNPKRFVKLMADYSSTGLWDSEGTCMSLDCFNLSPAFKIQLDYWVLWYEHNDDYLEECNRRQPPFEMAKFVKMGADLAIALKYELQDYTVMYYNELTRETTEIKI